MSSPAAKPGCVLVLQGGGAMGAYHVGAYQALQEGGFEPDWVCGISIGAINAAIIAGNPVARRLDRLDEFWRRISRPSVVPPFDCAGIKALEHELSFTATLVEGQPGFFTPRPVNPYFAPPGVAATSFYDTAPLIGTLAEMVDFEHLNRGSSTRLTVGATDVETGVLTFFDNHRLAGAFGPQHIAASGSLPPGFPATRVGDRLYWDGGCVSNSPIEAVQDDIPPGRSLVFVLDLWSASGPAPDTMDAVLWRAKQIQYASRTTLSVDWLAASVNLRHSTQALQGREAAASDPRLDVVHVTYRPDRVQLSSSDAEFSRESIAERRWEGLTDMRRLLAERRWERAARPPHQPCLIHRVA